MGAVVVASQTGTEVSQAFQDPLSLINESTCGKILQSADGQQYNVAEEHQRKLEEEEKKQRAEQQQVVVDGWPICSVCRL